MATPVPLALAARRLAPLVAAGLIPRAEAVEAVMELAIERCNWTPGHLREVELWIGRTLDRAVAAVPAIHPIVAETKAYRPVCDALTAHQRGLTAAAARADRRRAA